MKLLTCAMTFAVLAVQGSPPRPGQMPRVLIRPPQLTEHVRSSVEVSGEGLVGLSGPNAAGRLRNTEIEVGGLRPADRFVCVFIERASGLYAAEFVAPNTGHSSRMRFSLEARVLRRSGARFGELAVSAQGSATADCRGTSGFLSTRWVGQPRDRLALLVNSEQTNYVAASARGQPETACTPLRDAVGAPVVGRSFDRVCTVPEPRCGEAMTVAVYRRYHGTALPTIRTTIRGAC